MENHSKKVNPLEKSSDILTVVFSSKNKRWFIFALIVITFVAFSPSLKNDFVRWDDHVYVTENELIKDISINNIGKFSETVAGNFHPLTMISLALDYHFFELDPFYYHLKNLIYHLLNTVLVFFFIMKVSRKNIFVSFFTALLFGVHPMHVESVAWVSERKDVLYSFYFLLGLLLYYEYLQNKKIVFYILTFVAFVLSCLSKSAAVVFPVVLLLIDYYENEKITIDQLKSKILFFIVSGWIGIIALNTQSYAGAIEISEHTLWEKIQFSILGLKTYFIKFIFPYKLNNFHPYPDLTKNAGITFISALLILGTVFLVIKYSKKIMWLFLGLAFAFTTIVLVLQFLQIGGSFVSERYTYIPYIGIGLVYVKTIEILIRTFNKFKLILAFILVFQITSFTYLTHGQIKVWENTISLWENFIEKYPLYSSDAYNNLAEYYQQEGDTIRILDTYNKSLEENNQNYTTFTKRGRFYLDIRKDSLALLDFKKALSIKSDYYDAIVGEGVTYFRLQNFEEAIKSYNRAIQLDNNNYEVLNLRGNTYLKLNMKDKALDDINKALALNGSFTEALNTKALIMGQIDSDSLAIIQYNTTIENNANSYEAYTGLGIIYAKKNKYDLALKNYNLALSIKPDFSEALRGRAAIYWEQKQYQKTILDITEYLKLNPTNFDMLNRRALCYMYLNQFDMAVNDFSQLIISNPENGNYFQGRAFAYMKTGNNKSALTDLQKAKALGIEVDDRILSSLQTQ